MNQPATNRQDRRQFLKRATAAGASLAAAPYVIGSTARGAVAPSERITVGFIGVGGHGIGRNLRMFLGNDDCQPVALCDVDPRQISAALDVVRQRRGADFDCQQTGDWREVIARDDIDAVMISTPDHWHVPMAVAAMKAGKDVICEKPTLTIAEGQTLIETVDRYGAVFQLSTEDRSLAVYHRMAELVRNGRVGKLQRITVGLPSGPGNPGDPKPQPIPAGFDYDMWVGPAPWVPFRAGVHPFHWRWVSNFAAGMLADWGAHLFDTAQWGNDTERTGPVEIEGTGKQHENGLYDTFYEFDLTYRFANDVEMTVNSRGPALRFEGTDGWVGNRGWIGKLEANSPKILNSVIGPEETHLFTLPAGEHRNFLDCVKNRDDPYFPAEIGHRCCSLAHLGNIALELGRKLRWDPDAERFHDDDQANRKRSRAYREPWRL